jgi:asparagine synthase (glutamine-hydrolysing)
MFAFALQDTSSGRVFLVRDRLGIKPLLYTERDGQFLFASAMSALLSTGLVPPDPDPIGIRLYLHSQYIPWPHTAIAGVKKLPPATYLEIRDGVVGEPVRYWQLPDEAGDERRFDEWRDELRELVTDAVRVHMISDVEVGAFLSGGVDSSAVVGLMSRFAGHPVKAFSIGFEDKRVLDETRFAESAARRFGAEFHHTEFTALHVEEIVRDLIRHIEEPIGDPACLPTLYLSREARKHVKVVLTGEGADELFAGYGYYHRLPRYRPVWRQNLGRAGLRALLDRLTGTADPDEIHLRGRFRGKSPISGFPYVMSPEFIDLLVGSLHGLDASDIGVVVQRMERSWSPGTGSRLNRALHVDSSGWLPEDLLMKVDRTTMAYSLEARVPFLDYRVAELAMRMPAGVKIRDRVGKVVLREAFRELVGDELIDRRKHGFNLPMRDWVKRELGPLIQDSLGRLDDLPWLEPRAVHALFDAHDGRRGDLSRQIWSLFVLVEWFREIRTLRPESTQ